ncbi:MAG: hypothetical protein HY782_09235 [Chloroflexi bacterium]|nr:hypothetical protein [Chloroflexota bacterium]
MTKIAVIGSPSIVGEPWLTDYGVWKKKYAEILLAEDGETIEERYAYVYMTIESRWRWRRCRGRMGWGFRRGWGGLVE